MEPNKDRRRHEKRQHRAKTPAGEQKGIESGQGRVDGIDLEGSKPRQEQNPLPYVIARAAGLEVSEEEPEGPQNKERTEHLVVGGHLDHGDDEAAVNDP